MVNKKTNSTVRKTGKQRDLAIFLIVVSVVFLVNYIGSVSFIRLDLTAEKRFSLSDSTKTILRNLDDVVYVQCYLQGKDLPAGIKRLRNETREMLNEFRAYGGTNFEFEFIDPYSGTDKADHQKMIRQLVDDGLQPTNLQLQEEDGAKQLLIFPGALFSYKGRTVPVQLLRSQVNRNQEVVLNESIEGLEYEFARAIYILKMGMSRKNLLFTTGHDEASGPFLSDIGMDLSRFYNVKGVTITDDLRSIPMEANALVVAKPRKPFTEGEKFVLDQFVMRGGRILWLIDNVDASMDSLAKSQTGFTIGLPMQLNLDDLLFKYGVRLNYDLVLDAQSGRIPLVTGMYGNQPQTELKPWYYFPVVTPGEEHVIANRLPNMRFEFVGSLDTVKAEGVSKTILLKSSNLSKVLLAPVRIALSMVDQPTDEKSFNKKNVPLAVLLEGNFTSAFANRVVAKRDLEPGLQFLESAQKGSKMIVVADGDIIKNRFNLREGTPEPLGYDAKSNEYFPANKTFLLNSINYLMDDAWLIPLRSKQFKVRLLDKKLVKESGVSWKVLNMLIPIIFTILMGIIFLQYRKFKYGRKK
ncbi:MAG: gliding motility-associated ABC transporter substrate-binding protein GldG [Flavobacteriales bacterium]|nr:gliding motility-associated ABC transporter substrate-binding protein GldG [Flavobacteriales bacterium]